MRTEMCESPAKGSNIQIVSPFFEFSVDSCKKQSLA